MRLTIHLMNRSALIFFFSALLWSANSLAQEAALNKEVTAYEEANSEYLLIDAQKFILIQDYERALAALDQAIDVDQNNHAAYFKKSEVLVLTEQLDKAISNIETAISIQPNNLYYYVWLAQIHQQKEDLEAKAKIYELMLQNCKGYEKYGFEVVDVFAKTKRSKEALALIEDLKIIYPNYPELYLKQAEIQQNEGKAQESIVTISDAYARFPDDATLLLLHIQNLNRANKTAEAIMLLEEISEEFTEAKLLLVEVYQAGGQMEKSTALSLRIASNENVEIASRLLAMGYLLNGGKEHFKALDSLQQSLETQFPDNAMVFENASLLYNKMSQLGEASEMSLYKAKAIAALKSAAQKDPNNFDAWLKVFEYQLHFNQWNDLLTDVEFLLDLFPNQAILFFYYAEAQRGLRDYDEALLLIDQGLRMSGRNPLLQSLLKAEKSLVLVDMGSVTEAQSLFQQAINSAQVDERAIYYYALWLAETKPAQAIALMQSYREQISASPKWTYLQFKADFELGKEEEVKTNLEQFLQQNPLISFGGIFELYGDVLFKTGLTEEALVQWKKALNLGGFSIKLEDKIANKALN